MTTYEAWYKRVLDEGRAGGEAHGERQALLAVLAARSIKLSDEQATRVEQCKDKALLETWLSRAAVATSAHQIFD